MSIRSLAAAAALSVLSSSASGQITIDWNGAQYTEPTIVDAISFLGGEDALMIDGSATISVPPGDYTGQLTLGGFEFISVTLQSTAGPQVTKLRGGGPVVRLIGSVKAVTVRGFSITTNDSGRGVEIVNASPVVQNCYISCCSTDSVLGSPDGAGILAHKTDFRSTLEPQILDCVIWDCETDSGDGGGLYLADAGEGALVENCRIADNKAIGGYGGGLCQRTGRARIVGNQFLGNFAGLSGGGIAIRHSGKDFSRSGCLIERNRIAGNDLGDAQGMGAGLYVMDAKYRNVEVDRPLIVRFNAMIGNGHGAQVGSHPARLGGGFYVGAVHETFLVNNTIWENHASYQGGGGYIGHPDDDDQPHIADADEKAHLYNNLFWDNTQTSTLFPTSDLYFAGGVEGGAPLPIPDHYDFVQNASAPQFVQSTPAGPHEFGELDTTPDIGANILNPITGLTYWEENGAGDYGVFDVHLRATAGTLVSYVANGDVPQTTTLTSALTGALVAPPVDLAGVAVMADIDGDPVPATVGGSLNAALPVGADMRARQAYIWGGPPLPSKSLFGFAGFDGDTLLMFLPNGQVGLAMPPDGTFALIGDSAKAPPFPLLPVLIGTSGMDMSSFVLVLPNLGSGFEDCGPNT